MCGISKHTVYRKYNYYWLVCHLASDVILLQPTEVNLYCTSLLTQEILCILFTLFYFSSYRAVLHAENKTMRELLFLILDLFVVFRISDSLMNRSHNKESDSRVNENKGK